MKKACSYAKKYQGIVKPTCNSGLGCEACNKKWKARK